MNGSVINFEPRADERRKLTLNERRRFAKTAFRGVTPKNLDGFAKLLETDHRADTYITVTSGRLLNVRQSIEALFKRADANRHIRRKRDALERLLRKGYVVSAGPVPHDLGTSTRAFVVAREKFRLDSVPRHRPLDHPEHLRVSGPFCHGAQDPGLNAMMVSAMHTHAALQDWAEYLEHDGDDWRAARLTPILSGVYGDAEYMRRAYTTAGLAFVRGGAEWAGSVSAELVSAQHSLWDLQNRYGRDRPMHLAMSVASFGQDDAFRALQLLSRPKVLPQSGQTVSWHVPLGGAERQKRLISALAKDRQFWTDVSHDAHAKTMFEIWQSNRRRAA